MGEAVDLRFLEKIDSVELWVEAVGVEVEEAHEEARRGDVRALLQLEVVHVGHDQQDRAVRTYAP